MPEIGSFRPVQPPLASNVARIEVPVASRALLDLPIGQATPATVRQVAPPAPGQPGYQLQLDLGQRSLTLTSPLRIAPGTALKLIQGSDGQLRLLLPHPQQAAVADALRQHLPRQGPLTPLLNALSAQLSSAPMTLAALFQTLLGLRLNPQHPVSAERIQRWLLSSGLFFEANLAKGQASSQDLKGLLIALQQQIQPQHPQQQRPQQQHTQQEPPPSGSARSQGSLATLIEQALSRVTSNQLQSLGQPDKPEDGRELRLELPIGQGADNHSLKLRWRHTPAGKPTAGDTQERWQLSLEFDLKAGPLRVDLALQGEHLRTLCYCEGAVRQLLQAQLPRLQQALEATGLQITSLEIRPPLPVALRAASDTPPLIDLHT